MTATSLVRDITWHDTSQLTTFNVHHVTSQTTRLLHLTPQPTSWHQNSSNHHHGTSPPWNSRRLVHSKEMVCASRWSVALRAFYRQILSLLYTTFFFWNFRPRLARELLVYIIVIIHIILLFLGVDLDRWHSHKMPPHFCYSQPRVSAFGPNRRTRVRRWRNSHPLEGTRVHHIREQRRRAARKEDILGGQDFQRGWPWRWMSWKNHKPASEKHGWTGARKGGLTHFQQ